MPFLCCTLGTLAALIPVCPDKGLRRRPFACMQAILKGTRVQPGAIAAFVELHIEQGPLLEREGVRLGIVSAIAAPAALRVFFSGDGGHAGALLMPDRHPPKPLHSHAMSGMMQLLRGIGGALEHLNGAVPLGLPEDLSHTVQ